jgi:hypothetical protein
VISHLGYDVKIQGGSATRFTLRSEFYLDVIRDLDERNPAVHSVVFPVELHRPLDLPCAGLLPETVGVSFSGWIPRLL